MALQQHANPVERQARDSATDVYLYCMAYITTHFRSTIFCIVSRVDKRSITYPRHWLSGVC